MGIVSKKRYKIEMDGLPNFFAQKVTLPEKEFGETAYSTGKKMVKRPDGSYTIGDLVITGVVFDDVVENFAKEQIRDVLKGILPDLFMKNGRVQLLAADFITPLKTWEFEDVWLKKYAPGD